MIASKHITKIVLIIVAIAVVLCMVAVLLPDTLAKVLGNTAVVLEYEDKLFNTDEVMQVNILIDEDAWQTLLDQAISEEYVSCDVEINGETLRNVGIRPKGNTSLSSIANDPDTDRYSLKLEFDHYVEGQNCYGLDKLVLNNNYADATSMKEALIYDMYQYMDADAALYNYAKVSVNGQYWGLYLALEAVDESFMLRNYGTANGELYKPETMGVGGDEKKNNTDQGNTDFGNMTMPGNGNAQGGNATPSATPEGVDPTQAENGNTPQMPDNNGAQGGNATPPVMPEGFDPTQTENGNTPQMPDNNGAQGGNATPPVMPEGFDPTQAENGNTPQMPGNGGKSMMSGNGADLNYTDDDLDSYSTIWEGEVTSTGKADHQKVVKALKNIAQGTNLESYMDTENLLRYMAVHLFAVNEDSLSGSMCHNYYLYESGGRLNLLPWDYNLSFGGMGQGGSASSVINDPIDDAFSSTDFFDTLMADETYHSQYYANMRRLVEEYVQGGAFEAFYQRVRSQIDSLVETDPTAFYSYEEYLTAVEMLKATVQLRAESILGQLDGSIPSTQEEQQHSDALVDASRIDLTVMGQMNNGGDKQRGGDFSNDNTAQGENASQQSSQQNVPAVPENTQEEDTTLKLSVSANASAGMPMANQGGFNPGGQMPQGEMPEGFDPGQMTQGEMPEGFDPSQMTQGEMPEGFDPGQMPGQQTEGSESSSQTTEDSTQNFSAKRDFGFSGSSNASSVQNQQLITLGISALVMASALIFAVCYRRRNIR